MPGDTLQDGGSGRPYQDSDPESGQTQRAVGTFRILALHPESHENQCFGVMFFKD